MKTTKKIIPLAVIVMFITLALAPLTSAEEESSFELGYKDDNGYTFYQKITITPEQLQAFDTSYNTWCEKVQSYDDDQILGADEFIEFQTITISLIEEIRELTKDPVTGNYNFPEPILSLDTLVQFINDHLNINQGTSSTPVAPLPLRLQFRKIFSIGRGRAWLPLNRQGEQFIGARFLPIFIQYTIGYAKSRWINFIPPALCLEDRLGIFNEIVAGFVGLYINFGEKLLDRPAGPVLLIGRHAFIRLGEDIP